MADNALHFALKTIGRSTRKGRKPCDLLTAARHNLREIQAELGARGHIDPRRMADNVTLAGPATAAEVYANAADLLALVDLVTRPTLMQRDWLREGMGWRLAAEVHRLKDEMGWPVKSDRNPAKTGRQAIYSLPMYAKQAAHRLLKGGAA